MDQPHASTRAIVTGGAQGIGFTVASRPIDERCGAVALVNRSAEKGRRAAADLARDGVDAIFVCADVLKVEDCRRAVATAISSFGSVNVLVNAAGSSARGSLIETTPGLLEHCFATNVRSPFFLMQSI